MNDYILLSTNTHNIRMFLFMHRVDEYTILEKKGWSFITGDFKINFMAQVLPVGRRRRFISNRNKHFLRVRPLLNI